MPRNVTTSFRRSAEANFSDEVDLVFLTISHRTMSDPIRVVWDTVDFVYDGNTFVGFPFDITILSDDESPPTAKLTIQNVDPRIGDSIRLLQDPPRLKIELLSSSDFITTVNPRVEVGSPAPTVVYMADKLFLINVSVDIAVVTGTIVGMGLSATGLAGTACYGGKFSGIIQVNNRPWFEKYVGLPFADGGRDWKGIDCWGLVYLVFKHERGIDLPTYGEIAASELIKIAYKVAEETAKEPWHPAVTPQAFDMAVMYRKHAPIHVGVMADSLRVLHIETATNAVLIDVKHPSVRFRSIGYFRHTELLNVAA